MGKIKDYQNDTSISAGDKVIGTDTDNLSETKNYTFGDMLAYFQANITSNAQINAELMILGEESDPQILSTPDISKVVSFGPAQNSGSNEVQMLSNGSITFNQEGAYEVAIGIRFSRDSTVGVDSIFKTRTTVDGVAINDVNSISLEASTNVTYTKTFTRQFLSGNQLLVEFLLDSVGLFSGSLQPEVTTSSWDNTPSASIRITKLISA